MQNITAWKIAGVVEASKKGQQRRLLTCDQKKGKLSCKKDTEPTRGVGGPQKGRRGGTGTESEG